MFSNIGQITYNIYNALYNIALQIGDNIGILTGALLSVGIGLIIINLILNVINWYNIKNELIQRTFRIL